MHEWGIERCPSSTTAPSTTPMSTCPSTGRANSSQNVSAVGHRCPSTTCGPSLVPWRRRPRPPRERQPGRHICLAGTRGQFPHESASLWLPTAGAQSPVWVSRSMLSGSQPDAIDTAKRIGMTRPRIPLTGPTCCPVRPHGTRRHSPSGFPIEATGNPHGSAQARPQKSRTHRRSTAGDGPTSHHERVARAAPIAFVGSPRRSNAVDAQPPRNPTAPFGPARRVPVQRVAAT